MKPNGDCKDVADVGSILTDGSGRGRGHFEAQVDPKSAKFFATGFSLQDDHYNDPLIVKLKA